MKGKNMQKNISSIITNKEIYDSYCDRTIVGVIKLRLKCFLIFILTLGFAYPWIMCSLENARCSRTVIS